MVAAASPLVGTADPSLRRQHLNKMLSSAHAVRNLAEAQLRGSSRNTYQSGKKQFADFCLARGHRSLQPDLLRWWVAERLESMKAQTVQVQLAAVTSTADIGGGTPRIPQSVAGRSVQAEHSFGRVQGRAKKGASLAV